MKCPFCNDKKKPNHKEWDKKLDQHMVVTKDMNGHIHVHAPDADMHGKGTVRQFIAAAANHAGIKESQSTGGAGGQAGNVCYYCNPPATIGDGDEEVAEHLVVTQDAHNHIHVHGPLEKKNVMQEMVDAVCTHAEIDNPTIKTGLEEPKAGAVVGKAKVPDQVVFKNRQAIGDILTMTAGIRDFKAAFPDTQVGVITTAMHIWDHNPNVDLTLKDPDKILECGPGHLTNKSNRLDWHMCNAFRVDIENKLGLSIPQGDIRPNIWMTEEEYNRPPLIEGPYWIVIVGGEPGWPVKMYPEERWQEVINSLPEIQFVQLGVSKHPWPHLENVVDYIGKTEDRDTGLRDLFNLFLHSQGSLGLVSMHMHLSAAFNNPAVIVAGAREPMWFTHYMGQQYLQTNGCLPCGETTSCWKCKVEGCTDVQKRHGMEPQEKIPPCIDLIKPHEVVECVRKYYDGGRLEYGKKISNKFFKNIAKEANTVQVPKPVIIDNAPAKQFGMEWGGGSITDRDWDFMQKVVEKYQVKTLLEFGAGLSTLLFSDIVESSLTYETHDGWVKKIKEMSADNSEIRKWDGKEIKEELGQFDMCLIDGPAGGGTREFSTKIASEHAKVIVVHDAGRAPEKMWQEKYLKPNFQFASKGGHRCHLWVKPGLEATHIPTAVTISEERANKPPVLKVTPTEATTLDKSDVTLVSTARGWGGCARSITTIMRFLLERGKKVTFVPLHGVDRIGSEFADCLNTKLKDVKVCDYSAIAQPTGVLFVYADDFIWEFGKPLYQDTFSKTQADKKIMMLNYRRGKVGEVEWTRDWDRYAFLNTTQEQELLKVHPEAEGRTKVLPPCTDLTEFLKAKPDYSGLLKLIRHSSQGNTKFAKKDANNAKEFKDELTDIIAVRKDVQFHFMPGPDSVTADGQYIIKYPRNNPPVYEFLGLGNCFWYSLPIGYMDMGPRVILEAMAAGLPVIADNWGGAKDRVTPECGWLCDTKEQHVEVIKGISTKDLAEKGAASRQRAIDEFIPERWIDFVLGEK